MHTISNSAPTLRPINYVNLSILGFGLAAITTSLGQIILPMRVLDIAPEALKNTYLGILTFVGMATAMLVQPVMGYLSDRTKLSWGRRKPFIIVGSVLAIPCMIGIGLSGNYIWLVITTALVQMSANLAQSPYDAIVKDQVPQNLRGKVVSTRAVAGAGGAVTFVLLTGLLMDQHKVTVHDIWLWLAVSLPMGALVGCMIWTAVTLKDNQTGFTYSRSESEIRRHDSHPQFPWLLAAGFFFMVAGGILQTYTLFFLKDVVNLENPGAALGILAVVVGITILLCLMPAGILADRIGRRPLLIFSAIIGSSGTILFFFASNLIHVILIGIPLGIAVGIFMTAGRAMITDMVSTKWPAFQMGIANLVLLGGLATAKLGGIAIDALNRHGDNLGYHVLVGICAISFLIGAVLICTIKNENAQTVHRFKSEL
ncbi:MFS transporter [SAR202 cluster bacterium AD-804-J14_MRT_500m]|nr:MFS transporter [SAR202 cluster bacterium AD-804-J14_MRT_500m]